MVNQPGNQGDAGSRQSLLEFGQERISQQFNQAAEVVRRTTEGFDRNTGVSRLVERAADTLSDAGDYIAHADARHVVHDANAFAHRQPELFLGGAFLTGLILGRFLRSHPPENRDRADHNRMGYLGQMDEDLSATADEGQINREEGGLPRGR